jgi:predicted nucleic acid-binding protein
MRAVCDAHWRESRLTVGYPIIRSRSVGWKTRAAGRVRAELVAAGTPIGAYDILIAGQAVRSGATLVTADSREFARVRGLAWEDWTISAGP